MTLRAHVNLFGWLYKLCPEGIVLLRDMLCHLIPTSQIFLQLPKVSLYQELANNTEPSRPNTPVSNTLTELE